MTVGPDEVPRLAGWLRDGRPRTSPAELAALLAGLPSEHVRRLEAVLDELARTCRPPDPADLAALAELDGRLARGGS